MPRNNDIEFDRRLRDRLEPEPARVDCLVQNALSEAVRPPLSRRSVYRRTLATAAVVAAVLLYVYYLGPDPENQDRSGTESAGEVVLLQAPSGESWILGAGKSAITLPPGMGLVIIEGESK